MKNVTLSLLMPTFLLLLMLLLFKIPQAIHLPGSKITPVVEEATVAVVMVVMVAGEEDDLANDSTALGIMVGVQVRFQEAVLNIISVKGKVLGFGLILLNFQLHQINRDFYQVQSQIRCTKVGLECSWPNKILININTNFYTSPTTVFSTVGLSDSNP